MVGLGVVVIILVIHNLLSNLVVPAALYVPVNLAVAVVLLAVARWSGLCWGDLGLHRRSLRRGAIVGLAAFTVVAFAIAIGALMPITGPLFADQRVANITGPDVLYHAVVRIPLGTVVLEEVAFRGVLLALVSRVTSLRAAVGWSSILFGLWHIVPTIEALRSNRLDRSAALVAIAVAATAAAGVAFCWLRLRSGSLLAPALAHVATNSVALAVAVSALADG